jgi:hypothetical protein
VAKGAGVIVGKVATCIGQGATRGRTIAAGRPGQDRVGTGQGAKVVDTAAKPRGCAVSAEGAVRDRRVITVKDATADPALSIVAAEGVVADGEAASVIDGAA